MIPLFLGLGIARGGNSSSSANASANASASAAIGSFNTNYNFTPPGEGARVLPVRAATTNAELAQLTMSPVQRAVFGLYAQSSNYLADMLGVPRSEDVALGSQAQPIGSSANSNGNPSQSLDPHQQLAQMMAYRTVLGSLANNMNGLFGLAQRDDQLTMSEQLNNWSNQVAQHFNNGAGQNQSQNIPSPPNLSMLGQIPLYTLSNGYSGWPGSLAASGSAGSNNLGSYSSIGSFGGSESTERRFGNLAASRFV